MEYFVTGATGLIGTHLVGQLVEEGHDVVALTRSRSNAAHLPEEVAVVEGDITDPATIREPMDGVDGVFHAAAWFFVGPGPREAEKARRINVEGTRNVLELMGELDVEKGVYTSTIGIYAAHSGEPIDETFHPDRPTSAVYLDTKWRAHYEVAKPMMEAGLPLVVVEPGTVYGPYDKSYGSARAAFQDYLRGDLPVVPRGFRMPYDYAADTARAHVLAMERGEPGEEYIVASEPRTLTEVFEVAEELTGISAPRAVPDTVFGVLARVMGLVERVTTPPAGFEAETLRFLAGSQFDVDNAKARRELGLEHRPLAEGLREYVDWELDQMGLDVDVAPERSG